MIKCTCKTIENNPVFVCTFVLNKEPELVEVFTKFRYKLREEHNLLKETQIKVYISVGTINQSVLKKPVKLICVFCNCQKPAYTTCKMAYTLTVASFPGPVRSSLAVRNSCSK